MKNISLVMNGVLLVAVLILFGLHFQQKKQIDPNSSKSNNQIERPAEASGQLQVAYVYIDSLLANYKMAQQLTEKLVQRKTGLESELNSKGQKLEKKITDFQYEVQRGLITSWDAQEKEKKLGEEQQVFVNLQNDMQNRLMQDEAEMNQKVYEVVMEYVDNYNNEKGYNLIISQTTGGVLLFAEDYMNITKEVLDGLNASFVAEK